METEAVLSNYPENDASALIPILQDIQDVHGYLPEKELKKVSSHASLPMSRIYGVATFYSLFTTEAKGKHIIRCCNNAPCHVNGSKDVLENIKKYLQVEVGETTVDNEFTLEFTSCLGLCAVAPVMMVDNEVYGNLTPEKAVAILKDYKMKGASNA